MRNRSRLGLILIGMIALAAGLAAIARNTGDHTAVHWPSDGPGFGGWSGIDVSPDGTRFIAVSDSGTITRGRLLRDPSGVLTGIQAPRPQWIRPHRKGPDASDWRDSEGVDLGPEGSLHVSYEAASRIAQLTDWRAEGSDLDRGPFLEFGHNSGLEAVAVDDEGHVWTLPERSGGWAIPFPVYRLTEAGWGEVFGLARSGDWLPAGADFGPDGRLYILERRFIPPAFASRIRVVSASGPGERIRTGEIIYQSPLGRHGNLEGIGLWQAPEGILRAVMVTDDNYQWWQRSEIVEVPLPSH